MPDHTIKNLREVQNMAEQFGMEGMEARFASRDLELTESGLSLQKLDPGATSKFGHSHKRQEEVLIVLAGSGTATLDGEEVALNAWDALRIAPPVTRAFAAGPDGLEFLIYGAPKVENPMDDVEMES